MQTDFLTLKQAVADLKQGKMIILVDDENRENEGDLVIAAEYINTEKMNFLIRNGSGIVCLCLTAEKVAQLNLPMMVSDIENTCHFGTGFTVSIEAKAGVTTGVSAADRVRTIHTATHPQAQPGDLVRPGHVFPLCAKPWGVLERGGHTEGSIDLMRLAGLTPAAVICELMQVDGTMARMPDLEVFAKQYNLTIVSIAEIKRYRLYHENIMHLESVAKLPINDLGDFQIKIFRDQVKQQEYIVLQHGEISTDKPTLVRLHSQCITGDIFASKRCDCGWQLQAAMKKIAQEDGVIIYLAQEGRGIGLANKVKAYALQETGLDTVEANQCLGFAADLRDYAMAAQILRFLRAENIRLLTNNPSKMRALSQYGLQVVREALEMLPQAENQGYLKTKRDKLGHLLELTEYA